MSSGIIFAIITAILLGFWTVFHQQASTKINYLLGAILISLTAVIIGLIFLFPKIKTVNFSGNPKGILFVILAGICALGIDYFVLKAYGSGLPVSIVGPIVIGGSIAVASIIGFFIGESVTFPKILGLILVISGAALLSALTK